MTQQNSRTLDDIAANINDLQHATLFAIGDLLIEAKATCKHGEWSKWLENEFDWSPDTAQNYMKAAELGAKFRIIRNLKLPALVIYYLDGEDEEVIQDAVERLEAATKQGRVTVERGHEIIDLARARAEHGDLPDETLKAIERTAYSPNATEVVAALKEAKPVAKADADAIITRVHRQCTDDEDAEADDARADDDDADVEALLDGPPPALPPTQPPSPETQKFGPEAKSAWVEDFDEVIATINRLKTRSLKEFKDTAFDRDDLIAAADFINQVAGNDQSWGEGPHELQRINSTLTSEVKELKARIAELEAAPPAPRLDLPCEHSLVPADDTSSFPTAVAEAAATEPGDRSVKPLTNYDRAYVEAKAHPAMSADALAKKLDIDINVAGCARKDARRDQPAKGKTDAQSING